MPGSTTTASSDLAVADQVAEVDHLAGERVASGRIAAREKLAEVELFVLSVCHGQIDRDYPERVTCRP